MKRVLLDCDGVLSDFVGGVLAVINRQWGCDYRSEHVTQFDFCAALGMTKQQSALVKKMIGSAYRLAAELDVYPGAVEGVRRLREIAEVYVVTSPWNSNATWTYDREAWLWENFAIPHSHVIHTSAKHVCAGDFLVDDKTETLEKWCASENRVHGIRGVPVQWMTPHNRLDAWNGQRTNDWGQLVRWVSA